MKCIFYWSEHIYSYHANIFIRSVVWRPSWNSKWPPFCLKFPYSLHITLFVAKTYHKLDIISDLNIFTHICRHFYHIFGMAAILKIKMAAVLLRHCHIAWIYNTFSWQHYASRNLKMYILQYLYTDLNIFTHIYKHFIRSVVWWPSWNSKWPPLCS